MKIIAVDDKPMPRRALVTGIKEAEPDAEIVACANADEVLALPDLDTYEVAFVDIDMPGKNGVQLARELKEAYPRLNVVFATGFGEYMADAFELHSSGYIMKPVTAEKVRKELDNLRFPAEGQPHPQGLYVKCFGDFEVFSNGKPVAFNRAKSKELFAYLVDRRGAACSISDINEALWGEGSDDASQRSYTRTLVADMKSTFASIGYDNVVVKRRGVVGVRTDAFTCDYYEFLGGDPMAVAAYQGEYMRQYPWSEGPKQTPDAL